MPVWRFGQSAPGLRCSVAHMTPMIPVGPHGPKDALTRAAQSPYSTVGASISGQKRLFVSDTKRKPDAPAPDPDAESVLRLEDSSEGSSAAVAKSSAHSGA